MTTSIDVLAARRRLGVACLVLALGVVGCSDALPTAAVPAPSAGPVPPVTPAVSVLADATLSGVVYEVVSESPRELAGIEGVSVYCEQCGESTHNFAITDAKGEYVFPRGVWTEGRPLFPIRIYVEKAGYRDPVGLPNITPGNPSGPGWREVVIKGDTRFEIELVRR